MAGIPFDASRFEQEPIIGIVRGVGADALGGVLEAACASGLNYLEITLNTPQALNRITEAVHEFGGRLCIGAGTVLSQAEATAAVAAGARFLVAPTLNPQVADFCRERDIPYFPGALTPTEIEKAWNAGAYMVKVFPSGLVGPGFFQEIKGPFPNIKLLAVGGIRAENVGDYLGSGASAVAVGGSVFSSSRMEQGEFSVIQQDLERILFAVRGNLNKIE